jgi:hypothetical protein
MAESKGKGRIVVEALTLDEMSYQVKAKVDGLSLKQALSLRAIITSFETSAHKRGNGGTNVG